MPQVIFSCSGILIHGRRIKSLVFTTDIAIIRNCNADAVLAVYPFTPQQAITDAIIRASSLPVFCGVGGGHDRRAARGGACAGRGGAGRDGRGRQRADHRRDRRPDARRCGHPHRVHRAPRARRHRRAARRRRTAFETSPPRRARRRSSPPCAANSPTCRSSPPAGDAGDHRADHRRGRQRHQLYAADDQRAVPHPDGQVPAAQTSAEGGGSQFLSRFYKKRPCCVHTDNISGRYRNLSGADRRAAKTAKEESDMHRNWKTALALLLSAMLLLALAACSTGSDTTGGDATAAPTAEPTEAPTSEPVVLEPAEETEEPDDATTDTDATGDDADATGDDANATGDDADATGRRRPGQPARRLRLRAGAERALGFTVYELDAASGYTAQSFTAIAAPSARSSTPTTPAWSCACAPPRAPRTSPAYRAPR